MKKILAIMVALLLLSSAYAQMPERIPGEWISYGTLTTNGEDIVLQTTRADQLYGYDGFILHEDGGMEFTREGKENKFGSWEWEEDTQSILMTDNAGVQARYVEMDGMLYSVLYYGESEELMAYYRPSLYLLNEEYYFDCSWKLESFVDDCDQDTETEQVRNQLYERRRAWDEKVDYCITLNADGDADMLINYIPVDGEWTVDGFNIIIENEWGHVLELEPQLDESLFGTISYADGSAFRVDFDVAEHMIFWEPITSMEALNGSWEMTGLDTEFLFHKEKDELSFSQTMEIDDGIVQLEYTSSKGETSVMRGTAEIRGGVILNDKESGDVMVFNREDGYTYAFVILKDGRLYWKNPNNLSYYFEKVE